MRLLPSRCLSIELIVLLGCLGAFVESVPQPTPPTISETHGFKLHIQRVSKKLPRLGTVLSAQISLMNSHDFAYLINIGVGPQILPVILDTGSADLWVVSTDCSGPDCDGVPKYGNMSSSLQSTGTSFHLDYLVGSVSGSVGLETITMASYKVGQQVFAMASSTQGLGLSSTGNSGILGLSFPSTASISATTGNTLLENIFASFDEASRFFAFRLGQDDAAAGSASSFSFGQLDPDIANSTDGFRYTAVSMAGATDYNYWKLPLRGLSLNGTAMTITPSRIRGAEEPIAVLDTGTTLVLGPTSDVDELWGFASQGGGARKNPFTSMWEVRCERGMVVEFTLGDEASARAYALHPLDVNWSLGGSADGWCLGGIQGNDGINSGDWLLGDTFLRNVYVTHHGKNSTHPPLIGLLNLTDPSSALAQFRKARGPDPLPPLTRRVRANGSISRTSLNAVPLYMLSSICGFMSGAALTTLFRLWRRHVPATVTMIRD